MYVCAPKHRKRDRQRVLLALSQSHHTNLRACETLWSAREIASVALSAEQERHTENMFQIVSLYLSYSRDSSMLAAYTNTLTIRLFLPTQHRANHVPPSTCIIPKPVCVCVCVCVFTSPYVINGATRRGTTIERTRVSANRVISTLVVNVC